LSEVNRNFELLPWQLEVAASPARFDVIGAGRRTGKTEYAAIKLITKRLESTVGEVFYVAPTQGQARDIMWDKLLDLAGPLVKAVNKNNMEIEIFNGTKIKLKGSDRPDTMRGVKLYFAVLDEYADMKEDVWSVILRPALSDLQGEAMFIGTPMGRNHFYELYVKAQEDTTGTYKAWHYTTYDNPFVPKEEIEAAKAELPSWAFRQEYLASFEARGSQMFKEEWLRFTDEPPPDARCYIAIDMAGFENIGQRKKNKRLDDTAIAVVYVSAGNWHVANIIKGRWDINETAVKIFEAVKRYRPVAVGIEKGIARNAVMGPLMDLQKRSGKFFHVQELAHGNQKKTDRVMWALQGKFENGWVTLQKDDWNNEFLDQLFQFPDPLTHDDMVDALAYIDQMAEEVYGLDDEDYIEEEYILDSIAGY